MWLCARTSICCNSLWLISVRCNMMHSNVYNNSSWLAVAIWRHRTRSTSIQVMDCHMKAPGNNLNQWSTGILWYSPQSNICSEIALLKLLPHASGAIALIQAGRAGRVRHCDCRSLTNPTSSNAIRVCLTDDFYIYVLKCVEIVLCFYFSSL